MVAGVHTARFRVLKVGAAASPFGEPVVTLGAAHSIRWDESAVVGTVTAQRTVSLWLLLVAAAESFSLLPADPFGREEPDIVPGDVAPAGGFVLESRWSLGSSSIGMAFQDEDWESDSSGQTWTQEDVVLAKTPATNTRCAWGWQSGPTPRFRHGNMGVDARGFPSFGNAGEVDVIELCLDITSRNVTLSASKNGEFAGIIMCEAVSRTAAPREGRWVVEIAPQNEATWARSGQGTQGTAAHHVSISAADA